MTDQESFVNSEGRVPDCDVSGPEETLNTKTHGIKSREQHLREGLEREREGPNLVQMVNIH